MPTPEAAADRKPSGTLVLIVGPSGAGKDTIIDGARATFAGDPRFRFCRRVITRDAKAGGERHDPMDPEAFDRAEAAGAFVLSWRAHGHAYGIPHAIGRDLAVGHAVIVNGSRTVIGAAAQLATQHLARLVVVHVTASPAVLAARIAARGRETAPEIEMRLAREAPFDAGHETVVEIRNDGAVETAIAALADCLAAIGAQRG
jgi:ribose 1,5-bisphosphokinase